MQRHKRWSSKKEKYYQNTRSYIEELVLHHTKKRTKLIRSFLLNKDQLESSG